VTATPAQLMTASLFEVFGERDPAQRRAAMRRTFAADVIFHDPEGTVTGHEALEGRIKARYAGAPPSWAFQAAAPAAEVAELGRVTWTFGPPAGPEAVRGMDIGIIEDGRIAAMYTIVEPAA
jgi:SnoaL-like domain